MMDNDDFFGSSDFSDGDTDGGDDAFFGNDAGNGAFSSQFAQGSNAQQKSIDLGSGTNTAREKASDTFDPFLEDFDTTKQPEEDSPRSISYSIKVIIVGIVILVIGLLASRVATHFLSDTSNEAKEYTMDGSFQDSQSGIPQSQSGMQQQVQVATPQPQVQVQQSQVQRSVGDDWVAVDSASLSFDSVGVESTFTVLEKTVEVRGTGDTFELRCRLRGNISGLSGEYELIVPYSSISRIDKGTMLSVVYHSMFVGDTRVIYVEFS